MTKITGLGFSNVSSAYGPTFEAPVQNPATPAPLQQDVFERTTGQQRLLPLPKPHDSAPTRAAGLSSASSKQPISTTDEAVSLATRLDQMSRPERAVAKKRIGDYFAADPGELDKVLAQSDPATSKAVAKAAIDRFVYRGTVDRSFSTQENFNRIVKMCEAIDPNASSKDVARLLRRQYYSDDMLELGPIDVGKSDPKVSDELRGIVSRLPLKKGWQEVTGPDGKRLDIAHSLVALDAYAQNPGMVGKGKAWVFTDFGDAASGVLSHIGLRGAGDNNAVDRRGNDFGDVLIDRYTNNPSAPLSELLR